MKAKPLLGIELTTFKPEAKTLTIVLQDPCLQRILPSYSLSALAARGWELAWVAVAKKNICRDLIFFFFGTAPCEPQK